MREVHPPSFAKRAPTDLPFSRLVPGYRRVRTLASSSAPFAGHVAMQAQHIRAAHYAQHVRNVWRSCECGFGFGLTPSAQHPIECLPDGEDSLLKARQTGCTAEGMDSCTDNEDIVAHAPCPSSAVNPKLVRSEPSASRKGSGTTRIAIPISNASNATSTRRPSTINAPSSSI